MMQWPLENGAALSMDSRLGNRAHYASRKARLLKQHASAVAEVLPKRLHFSTRSGGDPVFNDATVE